MTMQPRPGNSIEAKKAETRRNAQRSALSIGGGVVAGAAFGLLTGSVGLAIFILVVGLAGGGYFGLKVRKAIEKDPNSPY